MSRFTLTKKSSDVIYISIDNKDLAVVISCYTQTLHNILSRPIQLAQFNKWSEVFCLVTLANKYLWPQNFIIKTTATALTKQKEQHGLGES